MERMSARIFSTTLLAFSLIGAAFTAACSDPAPPTGTGGATGSGGVAASGGATGSGGETGSGGAADPTIPTDTTQAGLEAFLAAGSYKSAPWVFDDVPRASNGGPHAQVRVYMNPTAIESIAAGNNVINADPGNTLGSMAVKELYDAEGTMTGAAIMLRTAMNDVMADWTYYCNSSVASTCGTDEAGPHYGTGISECAFCHGGMFLAEDATAP